LNGSGRLTGSIWVERKYLAGRGFKFLKRLPIDADMSVSSITGSNSNGVTGKAAGDHAALALKKASDIRKSEAQALVQLISQASDVAQAGGGGVGSIISYYA
jgi:hypothetical protein